MGQAKIRAKLRLNNPPPPTVDIDDFLKQLNAQSLLQFRNDAPSDTFYPLPSNQYEYIDPKGQVYDFGLGLEQLAPNAVNRIMGQVLPLIESKSFHLPFEQCFFQFEQKDKAGNPVVVIFHAEESDNAIRINAWRMMFAGRWAREDFYVTIWKEHGEAETFSWQNTKPSMSQRLMGGDVVGLIGACVVLLNSRPNDKVIMLQSVAAPLRAKSSHKSAPAPIRVLRINSALATRYDWKTIRPTPPAGGVKTRCPHNRRGHIRRYKSGIERWIQPMKIKGGATSPRPVTIDII